MTLDKHEMKLLLTAALIQLCIPNQPIKLAWLDGVFSRPGKLQETIKKLRISALITYDPFAQELRVLPHPGLNVLFEFQETPELFTNERPLDAVLAEVCKKTPERVILHSAGFAPLPPKPPDPPPSPGPENPSRIHVSMPMPTLENHAQKVHAHADSSRNPHVHVSCNSEGLKELHEHGGNLPLGNVNKDHDVGELNNRSTAEMMADIRRLNPAISDDHFGQWRERIEREDAALVNGIIRQVFLQRRQIKNIGGWMNACYLKGIKKKEEENV